MNSFVYCSSETTHAVFAAMLLMAKHGGGDAEGTVHGVY